MVEWINATERQPDAEVEVPSLSQRVILACGGGFMKIGRYDYNIKTWVDAEGFDAAGVTHWIELPLAPIGDKNNV